VAGGLLLLLILVPVILIKRGRTVGDPIPAGVDPGSDTRVLVPDPGHDDDAGPPGPRLSEVAIQSCSDPGAKRPSEACDHPPALDELLRAAAKDSASCLPRGAPGGSLPVIVDLSLAKAPATKKAAATVTPGKDGRTIKDPKVAQKCAQKLKERIEATGADMGKHEHAKYKLAFVVTYPASTE
jgi:hypothetical protein